MIIEEMISLTEGMAITAVEVEDFLLLEAVAEVEEVFLLPVMGTTETKDACPPRGYPLEIGIHPRQEGGVMILRDRVVQVGRKRRMETCLRRLKPN